MKQIEETVVDKSFASACGLWVFFIALAFLSSMIYFNSAALGESYHVDSTMAVGVFLFSSVPAIIAYVTGRVAVGKGLRTKANAKTKILGTVATIVIGACAGYVFSNSVVSNIKAQELAKQQAADKAEAEKIAKAKRVAALTPEQRAAEAQAEKMADARRAVESAQWKYGNVVDQLSNEKKGRYASLLANTVLDLKFPYNGGSAVTLTVYADKEDLHATFELSKGMIEEGQFIRLRFDDGKVINRIFDTIGSYSGFSNDRRKFYFATYLNSRPKQDFFAMLKASKKLKIELPIYGDGYRVVEFSTEGLDPSILPDAKQSVSKTKK